MSKFVAELKKNGVFAKEVRSAGVAYHSYYMASIAPALLSALKKVNIARPRLAWLALGHLDLSVGDAELKGVPSFRRRRKPLEEHVYLCETKGLKSCGLKQKVVLRN